VKIYYQWVIYPVNFEIHFEEKLIFKNQQFNKHHEDTKRQSANGVVGIEMLLEDTLYKL
jgi:hypothetical protein